MGQSMSVAGFGVVGFFHPNHRAKSGGAGMHVAIGRVPGSLETAEGIAFDIQPQFHFLDIGLFLAVVKQGVGRPNIEIEPALTGRGHMIHIGRPGEFYPDGNLV